MKYTYYIDYGSGYVQVNPDSNSAKLGIKRDLNVFIQRKFMDGSFTLIEDEFDAAYAYFITAGNFEAPIKVYENAVLKYEGWCSASNDYDIYQRIITISKFKTNDEYTPIVDILTKTVSGENIPFVNTLLDRFTLEGTATVANKAIAYTWVGSSFSQAGNRYDLGLIGRPSVTSIDSKFIIFDDHSRTIRAFDFDGTDFTPSATGTLLDLGAVLTGNYGHACIVDIDSTHVILYLPGIGTTASLTISGTTWSVSYSTMPYVQYPSVARINASNIAMVDDTTKQLRLINVVSTGGPIDLGDVSKPKICKIDTNYVALIDENKRQLQTYYYNSPNWEVNGEPIDIPFMNDASLTSIAANVVAIHDTYLGVIYYYTYAASAWTQTGTGTALSGGYSSGLAFNGTYLMQAISDSYTFQSRLSHNVENVIVKVLEDEYLYPDYNFPSTTGATFDIENTFFGSLETLEDIGTPNGVTPSNLYKYSIGEMLNFCEIFQNYWYLEEDGGVYYFKFVVPSQFSSVGTDIDVSEWKRYKGQRRIDEDTFINREKITFNNQLNSDFDVDWIEYDRNTNAEIITDYPLTTDLKFYMDILTKRQFRSFSKSGLFMVIASTTSPTYVASGTSPLDNTNVRNEAVCSSRIYENYMKDYRYANVGQFVMNGNNVDVQSTCRPILSFPEINLKLDSMPDSIASLDWGGGIKSYITELSIDLNTYICTIQSVQLDL